MLRKIEMSLFSWELASNLTTDSVLLNISSGTRSKSSAVYVYPVFVCIVLYHSGFSIWSELMGLSETPNEEYKLALTLSFNDFEPSRLTATRLRLRWSGWL